MDSAKFTTRVSCQEGDSNSHSLLSLFAKEIGTLAAFLCLYQLNLLVLWAVLYAASDHAKQILCFPRLFLLNFPSNFLFNWSHPKRVGIFYCFYTPSLENRHSVDECWKSILVTSVSLSCTWISACSLMWKTRAWQTFL